MNFIELFFLAVGLSMDAFAAAVCAGLAMPKADIKKAFIVGMYFGVFQAVMPLIGYVAGKQFTDGIIAYDHWIAFTLLCFIGGKMIVESFKDEELACKDEISSTPSHMLPLAVATSIDALVAGVSFAFLHVSIVPAVSFIGVTTLVISMWGVKVGQVFGTRYKSKAELAGGAILVLIGLKILLEHTNVINL